MPSCAGCDPRRPRAVLSERGRELLPRILEKLSDLQKLFISAGQFDRRLNEKMPEIVDDTIAGREKIVRDPRQQERIVGLFFDSARDWRDSLLVSAWTRCGAPGARGTWGPRRRERCTSALASSAMLVDRFLARLSEPLARESMAQRRGAPREDRRTLGALVRRPVRDPRTRRSSSSVSSRVLGFLMRPESAHDIARRLCSRLVARCREDNARHPCVGAGDRRANGRHASTRLFAAAIPRAAERLAPLVAAPSGQALAASRGFGSLAGLLGAAVGLVVGLRPRSWFSLIELTRIWFCHSVEYPRCIE